MLKITSPHNEKIKNLIRLAKNRERDKQSLIIIEGARAIKEAMRAGFLVSQAFFCRELIKDKSLLPNFPDFIEVEPSVFKRVSYAENPDGYLVLAKPKYLDLKDSKLSSQPLVLVLESLEKPGNLGAILRSAYAAKVDLIIINDPKTDIYNPNVIKASEGFLFNNQVLIATQKATYKFLKDHGILILATSIQATKIYTGIDFTKPYALVIGSESKGLSRSWLSLADEQIKIPMKPGIDSLNASVSTAIILFEAWRQRGFS